MNGEHVVQIKRKDRPKEDFISNGTAVEVIGNEWVLTLTDTTGERKQGMKIVLDKNDKFKFLRKKE